MKDPGVIQIEFSSKNTILAFLISALFYLLAIGIWQFTEIDINLVISFNSLYQHENTLSIMKFISGYGMSIITLSYVFVLIWMLKRDNLSSEFSFCFLIVASFFVATVVGDSLKEIIDRARPLAALPDQLSIQHLSASPAFPSGHATKSMALALPFIVLLSNKNYVLVLNKLLVLLVACMVCFSRIALQAHYVSDVVAGIGTAIFILPFAVWFTNFFYRKVKMDALKLNLLAKRFIILFVAFSILLAMM